MIVSEGEIVFLSWEGMKRFLKWLRNTFLIPSWFVIHSSWLCFDHSDLIS